MWGPVFSPHQGFISLSTTNRQHGTTSSGSNCGSSSNRYYTGTVPYASVLYTACHSVGTWSCMNRLRKETEFSESHFLTPGKRALCICHKLSSGFRKPGVPELMEETLQDGIVCILSHIYKTSKGIVPPLWVVLEGAMYLATWMKQVKITSTGGWWTNTCVSPINTREC